MKKQNLKSNSAITLVALIITVIVLLILATVSINLVINSGIISKTKYAVDKYSEEEVSKQIKMSYLEYENVRLYKSNLDVEEYIKNSLEKIFKETVTVEQEGKNLKITFNDSKNIYKYKSDGTVKKLMAPTEKLYGKFDEDNGILYIAATDKSSYNLLSKTTSGYYQIERLVDASKLVKVVIEDPIATTSGAMMFNGCSNMREIENLNNLHTENIETMRSMFNGCSSLTTLDLSNFDTSSVKYMQNIFSGCSALTTLDLRRFDTSCVENMSVMFSGCSALTILDLSNFDTANVINMQSMFSSCSYLTDLNLSNFNTNNVDNFKSMFYSCSKLNNLNLGKRFIINNIENASGMFSYTNQKIKIKATQSTADKIKQIRTSYTDSNFEIIN